MKLNKFFMALAATAMVGCSSEDVAEFTTAPAVEDSNLIELGSDFALAGVGEDGNVTRTHWAQSGKSLVNMFLPIYNGDATAGALLSVAADREAEAVGLCWLGQTPGTDVYTNYQFYHFGWLNNGETEAEFNCGNLTNGALYSDLKLDAGGTKGKEAETGNFVFVSGTGTPAADLNFNTGIYKTDNKAIFGGQYIVYYPFNKDFKDAGTIPAIAETVFNNVSTSYNTQELGRATFRYSRSVTIEGGDQAAGFGLHNLSKLVRLRVATPDGDALLGASPANAFDQIVLYSPSKKLLKQANLAADKIVAGNNGSDLYESTEGTKTITANFATPVEFISEKITPKVGGYITVLPTNVDDLKVLVHNSTDGTWATVDMPTDFDTDDLAYTLDIIVSAADFKSDFIAVDQTSLMQALKDAREVVNTDPTATPKIEVIGDITLAVPEGESTPYNFLINDAKDANITIKGDAIIVSQDVILKANTNMESDIRVLGKSCCSGINGGRLYIYGGTVSNVTMEKTEAKVNNETQYNDYNPYVIYASTGGVATVAAEKTFNVKAGRIDVSKSVQHKGNIVIAEGAKLTVYGTSPFLGDLNFMGGTVTNNGTIEVMKNGNFDMTDANGDATATDGQRMTNNGTFIHNVDAGVGTAVQQMIQNGEYRCRVDEQKKLDDAFIKWTACSVIEMVNTDAKSYDLGTAKNIKETGAYQHNKKYINIEVNTGDVTTFINSPSNDSENIQIGDLTVTKGGLNITYGLDKRTLTVNGDMTVKANTTITNSKKIDVKGGLTVEGKALTYKGGSTGSGTSKKYKNGGLAVGKDININGGTFNAAGIEKEDVDALNITCKNFYLTDGATAIIANRTEGDTQNLTVDGTISNPAGCTLNIVDANQDEKGSLIGYVTCKALKVGGTFTHSRPIVVK